MRGFSSGFNEMSSFQVDTGAELGQGTVPAAAQ